MPMVCDGCNEGRPTVAVLRAGWNPAPTIIVSDRKRSRLYTDASRPFGRAVPVPTNGGVDYRSEGEFTLSGGIICGNTVEQGYGGGVNHQGIGSFTMNGGEISGNTVSSLGGGVYCGNQSSFFIMNDGVISGNTASSGGGVLVFRTSLFTKTGGIIYGGDAAESLRNTVTGGSGHVARALSPVAWRNVTAGTGDNTEGGVFWLND